MLNDRGRIISLFLCFILLAGHGGIKKFENYFLYQKLNQYSK